MYACRYTSITISIATIIDADFDENSESAVRTDQLTEQKVETCYLRRGQNREKLWKT